MAFEPVLWLIFFLMNMGLIAFNLYQIVSLSDLEADYLNPYETASRINSVVIPEYLLHGAFCILFLLTGHWLFFLLNLLPAYMNIMRYMKQQHLIDVTEVFRVISVEKKIRVVKLGFYIVLFALVMIRLIFSVINSFADEDEAIHLFGLF